jgi:NAD(P)-dependent dehydrogenase (short-subunit alcohol dehydrogenase family)
MSLAGTSILVTGASSGIGAAVALAAGQAGARVALGARRRERLGELTDRIAALGGEAIACRLDATIEAEVAEFFACATAAHGIPDILVHCVGIVDHTPTEELSLERWREVLDANLTSAFLCARAALRAMKPHGRGRILMIGSLSAKVPRSDTAAYAASKFALDGLVRSLAIDGRAHGIAASIFHPGPVRTELGQSGEAAPDAALAAEDVARIVLTMLDLPAHANLFEATALPLRVPFLGRG